MKREDGLHGSPGFPSDNQLGACTHALIDRDEALGKDTEALSAHELILRMQQDDAKRQLLAAGLLLKQFHVSVVACVEHHVALVDKFPSGLKITILGTGYRFEVAAARAPHLSDDREARHFKPIDRFLFDL